MNVRSIRFYLVFCLFSALFPISQLPAQESDRDIPTLDPVVVTATRTEVPLEQAASSVTIIDSNTMEEKHLTTASEALRAVPGLDIDKTGGPGGNVSARLRGGNTNHTLVLIDGVEINEATSGQFDFADLTTENIDRIEVVRGPQSTLYGSNAIGGVINIITKKGSGPPTPSLSFEAGSFRTFRETVGLSGGRGRFDYSLSVSRLDTAGFSAASERNGNTEKDGYENTSFSSRLGAEFMEKSRLEWTARYTGSRVELDFCSETDDLNCILRRKMLVNALTLTTPILSRWSHQLRLSLTSEGLRGRDSDDPFGGYDIENSRRRIDWRHDVTILPVDLLTIGYEYESQAGEFKSAFPGYDERLTNHAVFAFNQFRPIPFILNLGVRYDDNNRFGEEITYKAEVAYLIESTGSKVRAAYGTGFRGPTLNDLFSPGASDPTLQPEKSRSWEAGVDQEFADGKFRLSATYFQSRIRDLIVFVFDPVTFRGLPENQTAKIRGTELEFSGRPSRGLILKAAYTLTDAENEETGRDLARRPRVKANGTIVLLPMTALRVDFDLRYVGKRFNDPSNTVLVDDYTLVHLATTYDITDRTQLFARIENLFDREYEEVAGYQTAGFSVFGGVKMTF